MNNENSLEESFFEVMKKKEVVPDMLDLGDAGLNKIAENMELLSEVPFFKILYGLVKTGGAFRDYFLTRKIIRFLKQLESLTDEERANMFFDLQDDADKRKEFGELALAVLDKAESVEKADFFGKLGKYLARREMNSSEFARNLMIISNLISSDLKKLPIYFSEQGKNEISPSLHSMGLLVRTAGFDNHGNDVEEDKYMISGLGKKFVRWLELD